MRRARSSSQYTEANVWPAVTDTMILMASIFIVLSVVAMVTMSRRLQDALGEGGEGKAPRAQYFVTNFEAESLFEPGQDRVSDPVLVKQRLKDVLDLMTSKYKGRNGDLKDAPLKQLVAFANAQKNWKKRFFIVIEVGGHADSDPLRRAHQPYYDENWDLAARRAVAVVHLMEDLLRDNRELKQALNFSRDSLNVALEGSTVIRAASYTNQLPRNYTKGKTFYTQAEKQANRRIVIRAFAQPDFWLREQPFTEAGSKS